MKNNAGFQTIALTRIHESATNPRRIFDESKLAELASFVPGTKSVSSLSAESSKIRRGLVTVSVRTARGRLRYSVAVFVFMGCSPLSGSACGGGRADGVGPSAS